MAFRLGSRLRHRERKKKCQDRVNRLNSLDHAGMIEYDGLALNVAKNPKKPGASLTPRGRKQRDLLDGNAVPLLGAP